MKTPEEIKCGMECIRTNAERICVKPEKGQCPRCEQLVGEALVRIRQLEQRLAQVERERDAAAKEMRMAFGMASVCRSCKYNDVDELVCLDCKCGDLWRWRGIVEENS